MTEQAITKNKFIYDFAMNTSRPVCELEIFLRALVDENPTKSGGGGAVKPEEKVTHRYISYGHKLGNGMRIEITDEFENSKQFASQQDAAKYLGTCQSNISRAIAERKRINGYLITRILQTK